MKLFGIIIPKEVYLPVIIVLIAIVVEKFLKFIVKKTFNPNKKHHRFDSRKLRTIRTMISNIKENLYSLIVFFICAYNLLIMDSSF